MTLRRWVTATCCAGLMLAAGTAWAAWWLGPRTLLAATGWAATSGRAEAAARRVTPGLRRDFAAAGLAWGAPLLLRVFKLESTLEVWVEREGRYVLFRSFPICAWSGQLGPK
jgi:murein L,D-transpeptidase YafK